MTRFHDRWLDMRARRVGYYERLWPNWRNQRRRRLLVTLWLTCVVVCAATGVPMALSAFDLLLWMALLVVTLCCYFAVKVVTSDVAERPRQLLDERELALRGRYSYFGFLVATSSLTITAVTLTVTPLGRYPLGAYVIAMPLLLLSIGTPSALLAWQLPDDDPEHIGDDRVPHPGGEIRG